MHLRPSSRGLQDAPSQESCSHEEQNETIQVVHIGCNILHKEYYIIFIPITSSIFYMYLKSLSFLKNF
jgi:hypothetical protein